MKNRVLIRHRAFSLILTLALLLAASTASVRAYTLPDEEPVLAENALPENLEGVPGATADWWSAVQEDIRQSEYHITWQGHADLAGVGAAYQAPNRAHNLRTTFTPQSIRAVPRVFEEETPPWEWGLTLSGYGREGDVRPVAAATLQADGNRITYERDALTEWYLNDEQGLEQGFTLHAPPQSAIRNPQSKIVLALALTGDLTPNLTEDGSAIEFTTAGGVRVLRYSDLYAYDATGRTLPAQMQLVTNHAMHIIVDDANALYPITIDPLATGPNWTAEGDQDYAEFGYSVGTAGDVNGDGYADVIVGAYGYDNDQTNEGRAFVYHGSATGLSTTDNWHAEGDQAFASFGRSVGTAGDVNGDGYDDVIVGANTYDNGETNEGRAFVYHGSASGLSTTPDWNAEGNQAGAWFGISVGTAGDVNGDGYADVIVGAYGYDNGETDEGGAFVYHGSATGLSTTADWTAESDQASAHFGGSVGTAGDVNGDGYSDVIVGAYGYDHGETDEGRAFVYHGSATGLSTMADWTAEGDQINAYFGQSVGTAGDVNGDGYTDVIVGADYYDNGEMDEGAAFVYHGSAAGLSTIADWTAGGDQASARFGHSVGTAGDVNGDGYADVVVGAYGYDNPDSYEGRVTVYHGSAAGLSETPDWTAEGNRDGVAFGESVGTAGDVNGDGYADLIVGAAGYENSQIAEGGAFIYHGLPTGLSTTADWIAEGDQEEAYFGYSVGTAGDVNGDGYADVIVGARYYDNGETDEGRAFVYHGSATGFSTTPAWTAESDQVGADFGYSVGTAGDVNGDGYSDVIVGAYGYDDDQTMEGRAYVYHGSATGLSTTDNWHAEGDQANARFGHSVGTAGDVNGDGYSDVIVGAYGYDRAYVYHGSATGLSTMADWTAVGDQAGAQFGHSVGTAGDVNGDGYADVVVGAPYYDNDEANEGRAFVFCGSAAGLPATADWTAEGDQAGADFGWSVGTAGDVNGDGYADVVVGARYYDNGETNEGCAFVYHGSATGLSTTADWTAESDQASAYFGWSVGTAGDVNGDGYADVIVGANRYDNSQMDEGRVTVYYGSATGLSTVPAWTAEGNRDGAEFGHSVGTAGDVNGDGYADVIVGAVGYENDLPEEGRAYVYHGSVTGLSTMADWTAEGDQAGAYFGISAGTAGDVNGDGYADVIVGASYYDNGETDEGAAFVYHGSAAGLSTMADWTAEGDQASAYFGRSVGTAGDVNGDGYADVIVGAYGYDHGQTDEGQACVYHGSATGLSTTADWTAEGDQAGAYFGRSVGTAGDVNSDGYADIIVGANSYDNGQTDEGRAYVYHGSAAGLSTTEKWAREGNQDGALFGSSVGTAGDVNGDGYADVIVGASYYDNGETNEGRVTVYHGSATGLSTTADWSAESDQANAYFGISVGTAGDVNGDGYADVIVGAPYYDNGQTDEGRVTVYCGSATGLSTAADWTTEGNQPSARFGYSVGTAGDVNGDGYADVIVGAPSYDYGQTDEGRAYLFCGSALGLGLAWRAESDQASAWFGYSVATAGDVNGDSYADVIVGAYRYDDGQTDEGRAFLYYGNGGEGLHITPQQRRADDSALVAPGDQPISPTEVRLTALARTPFGRSQVCLQWEVKPEGTPFDGTGLIQSAWQDSGTAGYAFNQLISSLSFETRYHWRVRVVGRPANAATNSAITYRSRWLYGSTFFTGLSGEQPIGGTGQTYLLSQSSYVSVTTQGSLSNLTLRGYPFTAHPQEDYNGGGAQILDRYYTIVPNTGASGYALTLCLAYQDSDVTAAGVDENNLRLCRWIRSGWSCPERAAGSDTTTNLVCAESVTALSDWVIGDVDGSGGPTAVTLSAFSAAWNGDAVTVAWETAMEIDTVGFNVWRSETRDGDYVRVNDTLIPSASPGSVWGGAYSYIDSDVTSGTTYYYKLEELEVSGARNWYGPASTGDDNPTSVILFRATAGRAGVATRAWWLVGVAVVAGAGLAVARLTRRRR